MHNAALFFTQRVKVLLAQGMSKFGRQQDFEGTCHQNLLNIDADDVVTAYLRVKNLNDTGFINSHYMLFLRRTGCHQETLLEQYSRHVRDGVNAHHHPAKTTDSVIEVRTIAETSEIVDCQPASRSCIRFHERKRGTRNGTCGYRCTRYHLSVEDGSGWSNRNDSYQRPWKRKPSLRWYLKAVYQ